MSKQSLVYLRPAEDANGHTGCGVVVAGGLVATCRHVWEEASATGAVVARFPFPAQPEHRGVSFRLALFDPCMGEDGLKPDLVLLSFSGAQPHGLAQAALAHEARHQAGECYCHARLPSRSVDDELQGKVGEGCNEEGLRTFASTAPLTYWVEKGSSGAPVYRNGGALVGLLRERDGGGGGQPGELRMSFIVPASAIWPHVARAARAVADQHIPAAEFEALLIAIGEEGLAPREIPRRLTEIIAGQKAAAREPVAPSNLGDEVTGTIHAVRDLMGKESAGAALAKLDREVERIRERRQHAAMAEAALLRERARVEKLALRWRDAKATYAKLARLDPDDGGWAYVEIGDIEQRYGCTGAALEAYRKALGRAPEGTRRAALAQNRIGDMLAARGDGGGALSAFRKSLALDERLAADDPDSAEARRDLSVSHERIGDMLAARGDSDGALDAYRKSLAFAERLAAGDPDSAVARRDLSVSHSKIGDMLAARGDSEGALDAYRKSLALDERLAADDPDSAVARRDLSFSHNKIGDMLAARGDGGGALDAYRKSLALRERLAADDPDSAEARRALAVSHFKVGDALAKTGDAAAALAAVRKALSLFKNLAARDGASSVAQFDLAECLIRVWEMRQEDAAALERAIAHLDSFERRNLKVDGDLWLHPDLPSMAARARAASAALKDGRA